MRGIVTGYVSWFAMFVHIYGYIYVSHSVDLAQAVNVTSSNIGKGRRITINVVDERNSKILWQQVRAAQFSLSRVTLCAIPTYPYFVLLLTASFPALSLL